MTVTKVVNTVLLPGGAPAPERHRVKVRVQLVSGGFDTDSSFTGGQQIPELIGLDNVTVKPNGQWELDLPPNSQLSPADTYYRVEELVGRVPAVYNIIVPAPIAVSAISRTSNEVTATVPVGHEIEVGDVILVDVTDGTFSGTFTVTVSGSTTIRWNQTAANDPDGGTGFITKDWDINDLVIP